jgi:hypothetical protein
VAHTNSAELTVAEDELLEIRNDRRLKLKCSSTDTASLWLPLWQEYHIITKKATEALWPFSAEYLCEAGFSSMNMMKSTNKLRLQTLQEDVRVGLSTIRPQTRDIMRHHQAQVPHWYLYAYIEIFYFYSCLYFKKFLTIFMVILSKKH